MRSSIITSLCLAATAVMAMPANLAPRQATICTGLYGTPQCCATDVLGVADLNCANPPAAPTSEQNFVDTCAAIGQQARCCAIPILGQALLCDAPLG
ncbi:hypothetical protein K461DRAFT_292280 [Myriangium duriaei CBS 260.36]|uniref:Uncharacterized protein n=1 Tax=Myriangium duriaei CBS 260.36 TaxID=1168546 RepID=A0A9P4J8K3_9PEZI|nr:hypothetical protein K461DRAFT_292280 [Myriangium duriaei CBS 260.36]